MKIKGSYKEFEFDFEGDIQDFLEIFRELKNEREEYISYPPYSPLEPYSPSDDFDPFSPYYKPPMYYGPIITCRTGGE